MLQIAVDHAQRLANRRLEREKGRHDAAEDLSELSEGEKEKGESQPVNKISRINSEMVMWSDENKSRQLYIVLIRYPKSSNPLPFVPFLNGRWFNPVMYMTTCSIHGLVRSENMELGRDSDTGGQVKYVVELARALADMEGVIRVDLLTRQIACTDVDYGYGEPIEMLSSPPEGSGNCGAYIVRIPCGPRDKYFI